MHKNEFLSIKNILLLLLYVLHWKQHKAVAEAHFNVNSFCLSFRRYSKQPLHSTILSLQMGTD